MIEPERLLAACRAARDDLLAERADGHWTGELASSALSTATAVSALAIVRRHLEATAGPLDERLCGLIVAGLDWLADRQNPDGGWGDTDKSHSNIATTLLVIAAFHLTVIPADHQDMLDQAEAYVKARGGVAALKRRYGRDKTFAAPILANCALAGTVPWREVAALPFELACVPQAWYRYVRLPVVSYAIPALVAIGQARFVHAPPLNPIARWIRLRAIARSLEVVTRMQPESGGFLEATPLTSFVVMSLASSGHDRHKVVQQGVKFLIDSARPDGSWPIDTNLATWLTSLAAHALGEGALSPQGIQWLLDCQHVRPHPYTGARPGGWGWSDLSGAVPDADDTPAALVALSAWLTAPTADDPELVRRAALSGRQGVLWLLNLQNRDGGWPTFCRGWGVLPFDRSGSDLTAHAIRALHLWRDARLSTAHSRGELEPLFAPRETQWIPSAIERGFGFLDRQQRDDGSWTPLWFGNQDHAAEENPWYGTSRVLLAYRDLGRWHNILAQRAVRWLLQTQNEDGGWGSAAPNREDRLRRSPGKPEAHRESKNAGSSVEETALVVESLVDATDPETVAAVDRGLAWLIQRVETKRHCASAPIGLYFAKLWYYERLYPLIFTAAALARAVRSRCGAASAATAAASLKGMPAALEAMSNEPGGPFDGRSAANGRYVPVAPELVRRTGVGERAAPAANAAEVRDETGA